MKQYLLAAFTLALLAACSPAPAQAPGPDTTANTETPVLGSVADAVTQVAEATAEPTAQAEPTSEPEPTQAEPTSEPDEPTATLTEAAASAPTATAGSQQPTATTADAAQPTATASQPAQPTATQATASTPVQGEDSAPPITADQSGAQESLSAEEEAAVGEDVLYSGTVCRFALEDLSCSCIPGSALVTTSFGDPNSLSLSITVGGNTAVYQMSRLGINSWLGSLSADEGATFETTILFRGAGFDQQVTATFPDGRSATCVNTWNR